MHKHLLFITLTFGALTAAASAQVAPSAGDIAISEIMPNPGPDACVTDNNGEYFEVTNISKLILTLDGVFIQDATINTTTPSVTPTGVFFKIKASIAPNPAKITNFYPGQKLLFCRKANSGVNGNLANVDYEYAAAAGAPADNSQIASTGMNFNNGSDGIFVTVGGPAVVPTPNPNGYVAGTIVEQISYNTSATPFTSSGAGQAGERKDLFSPMQIVFTGASAPFGVANSSNLALSTKVNTSCTGNTFVGTPGLRNATDTTSWPTNANYDSVNYPNTGAMKALGPISVGAGSIDFSVAGPAGEALFFGYADDTNGASEFPLSLIFPGNPGSIVIDLFTAGYLDGYSFDGSGLINVGVPANPLIIGLKFELQWLAFDSVNGVLVASNGVRSEVCP